MILLQKAFLILLLMINPVNSHIGMGSDLKFWSLLGSRAWAAGGMAEPSSPPKRLKLAEKMGRYYDYSTVMDFEPGDLIYGLNVARAETISGMRRGKCNKPGLSDDALLRTADNYNNLFLKLLYEEHEGRLPQQSQEVQVVENFANRMKLEGRLRVQDQERFVNYILEFLKNERYNPRLPPKKASGGKADQAYELNLVSGPARKQEEDNNRLLARACKAAVFFAHSQKKKIHFILDGLDLDDVFRPESANYKTFTSKELRAIREASEADEGILSTVIFYRGGKRLSAAPWIGSDALDEHRAGSSTSDPRTP